MDKVRKFLPDISVGLIGDGQVNIQDITIITIQSAFEAFKQKPTEKESEAVTEQFSTFLGGFRPY